MGSALRLALAAAGWRGGWSWWLTLCDRVIAELRAHSGDLEELWGASSIRSTRQTARRTDITYHLLIRTWDAPHWKCIKNLYKTDTRKRGFRYEMIT